MSFIQPISDGPDFDEQKMRQVILYFIRNGDPKTLGKTKLMKLLYYADFDHYELHDEPITGATYRRLNQGPVATVAFPILEKMAEEGLLTIDSTDTPSYSRVQYAAIAPFNESIFTNQELNTLRSVAETWKTVKMEDIVAASHDDPPWNAVANNAEIPYYLVYYRNSFGEMALESDEGDGVDDLLTEDQFFGRTIYAKSLQ